MALPHFPQVVCNRRLLSLIYVNCIVFPFLTGLSSFFPRSYFSDQFNLSHLIRPTSKSRKQFTCKRFTRVSKTCKRPQLLNRYKGLSPLTQTVWLKQVSALPVQNKLSVYDMYGAYRSSFLLSPVVVLVFLVCLGFFYFSLFIALASSYFVSDEGVRSETSKPVIPN